MCQDKIPDVFFVEKQQIQLKISGLNLIGEFPVAIDNKGRLRLPSSLLRQLPAPTVGTGADPEGYEFVINRGFEKCLTLYPKPVWDDISARLNRLNRFNDRNRTFIRAFYLGAYTVVTDSADRILLQKPSMEYGGLDDEAILVAMDDRIEIWSPAEYKLVSQIDSNTLIDLSNDVMGGGIDGVGGKEDNELDDILRIR